MTVTFNRWQIRIDPGVIGEPEYLVTIAPPRRFTPTYHGRYFSAVRQRAQREWRKIVEVRPHLAGNQLDFRLCSSDGTAVNKF